MAPHPLVVVLMGGLVILGGCARAPIRDASEAMRPTSAPRSGLQDDMQLADLARAIDAQIAQLRRGDSAALMQFGARKISRGEYALALQALSQSLQNDLSGAQFYSKIKNEFEFFEVYGDKNWSEVFVTSYFEPVLRGSKKKRGPFTQPLYGYPKDMVTVNLNAFAQTQTSPVAVANYSRNVTDNIARDGYLRGRIDAQGERKMVVPYYSRKEIEGQNSVLKNQAEVLCYVDPVDAFFLQIQGSGQVEFADGTTMQLGYAGQNGHPYRAIGQALFHVIPKETMTAQKIESHLRGLPSRSAQKIMNENPSYVFFQKIQTAPLTSFGNEVQPGRTIATDPRYFPKGALGFLIYQKPKFARTMSDLLIAKAEASSASAASSGDSAGSDAGVAVAARAEADAAPVLAEKPTANGGVGVAAPLPLQQPLPLPDDPSVKDAPVEFETSSRFVLDQDTGGAIRGPHRVDLFWGRGAEAAKVSGVMRHPGRLYYLVPK